MEHCCYLIRNSVNNKVYVGVTKKTIDQRFAEHAKISNFKNDKNKYAINHAIAKYGKDNFNIIELEKFGSSDLAYAAEVKYINQYQSNKAKYGYNETSGGKAGSIYKLSLNKKLICDVLTGYCEGLKVRDMANKHGISYYRIFDITRLIFSKDHEIPKELIERVRCKKYKSSKRKKINKDIAINILSDFSTGKYSITKLAKIYNVSTSNMFSIVKRLTFSYIVIDTKITKKINKILTNKRLRKMAKTIQNNDDIVGSFSDYPNDAYKKFFDKFLETDKLEIKAWRPINVLAYFCNKYEQHYNEKYKFKFNSPKPSNCYEMFQIKKLASMISSDPEILKSYIDWVFKTRVKEAKRKLTSIAFLTVESLSVEYKMKYLFTNSHKIQLSRSFPLPIEYKSILDKAGLSINTYGDLAFLVQMQNPGERVLAAFEELKIIGFSFETLKKVI